MGNKEIQMDIATFAGGCFWCIEYRFQSYQGVITAVSGYTGGHEENPTYEDVCSGLSGHLEAVQVTFDPQIAPYEKLLDIFWHQVDPTDPGGQFMDRGSQYRTAIFFHNDQQRHLAELSKKKLSDAGFFEKPIATEIIPFSKFYPAEDYHQGYSRKNPIRYKFYRRNSGRDQYLERLWKNRKT